MPSRAGFKLNRAVFAELTPADTAAGAFLMIEVYSNPGNPIYIDGITHGTIVDPNETQVQVNRRAYLIRDVKFNPNVPIPGLNVLAQSWEILWSDHPVGRGTSQQDFKEPLVLEAGYTYTLLVQTPTANTAQSNNLVLEGALRGRTVPDNPVEPMPIDLRSGIADQLPEGKEVKGGC